jgi:hypothetical protein
MANAPLPDPVPVGTRSWIGATSVCLGLIGLALSWLPPYAAVFSSIGLLCSLIALFRPSVRAGYGLRFALGGLALSLIGLVVCLLLMPTGLYTLWPFRAS